MSKIEEVNKSQVLTGQRRITLSRKKIQRPLNASDKSVLVAASTSQVNQTCFSLAN
jgi:hypothetical protein